MFLGPMFGNCRTGEGHILGTSANLRILCRVFVSPIVGALVSHVFVCFGLVVGQCLVNFGLFDQYFGGVWYFCFW
jgi:hypothetical protein